MTKPCGRLTTVSANAFMLLDWRYGYLAFKVCPKPNLFLKYLNVNITFPGKPKKQLHMVFPSSCSVNLTISRDEVTWYWWSISGSCGGTEYGRAMWRETSHVWWWRCLRIDKRRGRGNSNKDKKMHVGSVSFFGYIRVRTTSIHHILN